MYNIIWYGKKEEYLRDKVAYLETARDENLGTFSDIIIEQIKDGRSYTIILEPIIITEEEELLKFEQNLFIYLVRSRECMVGEYLERYAFDIFFEDHDEAGNDIVVDNKRFVLNEIGWRRVE